MKPMELIVKSKYNFQNKKSQNIQDDINEFINTNKISHNAHLIDG